MEAPTVKAFSDVATCPKCGQSDGMPVLYPGSFILTRYCAGGKEPEENPAESSDPMAQMASVLSKVASVHNQVGMEHLIPSKLNICAGIGEEHLHKICSRCQFEWLTQTKDAR